MRHASVRTSLVGLSLLLALTGCQTIDSIGGAADSLSSMGESTGKLADTASESIAEVKKTVGVLGVQIERIGAQVESAMPQAAETTKTLLETINTTAREAGAATTKMIERSAVAVEELTPEVKSTLASMRETVDLTGKSLENISKRMDGTMVTLQELTANLKNSTAAGAEMIRETQKDLHGALAEAQKALVQTSASLVRLEEESVTTLKSMQDSLGKISQTFSIFARGEDDEDDRMIQALGKRLDGLITLFVWVQLLGGLTLIIVTVMFIHHKATTKARHEAMVRKLGIDLDHAD